MVGNGWRRTFHGTFIIAGVLSIETFYRLVHHALDYPFDQVRELPLQKQVEIIALLPHDSCEMLSRQGIELLLRIYGTFGMFGTSQTFDAFRTPYLPDLIGHAQPFALAEGLQGL